MYQHLLLLSVAALAVSGCSPDVVREPTAPSSPTRSVSGAASPATRTLRVQGTLQARETASSFDPQTGILADRLDGTGTASHLGRYVVVIDPLTVNTLQGTSVGQVTITAANGDVLTGPEIGVGVPAGVGFADIEETVTITGGTGRFTGATGTLTFARHLDQTTGLSSGTLDGTVSLPH